MMTKKEIIDLVKEIGSDIGNKKRSLFSENENSGKIGNNQFRELASICHSAECYEEIELLIKYNTAKSIKNNNDESWAVFCENKRFGNIVIEKMKKIHEFEKEDEEVLKSLEAFFGYLYWQARIWTSLDEKGE